MKEQLIKAAGKYVETLIVGGTALAAAVNVVKFIKKELED